MLYYNTEQYQIHKGKCEDVLTNLKEGMADMIFADPPYNLSNDGFTCNDGKMVSVNKGEWDRSKGFNEDLDFTFKWIKLCCNVLKPNGTIWISGTLHNIYQTGYVLQKLGFHILNDIVWFKPNAPPNLSCRFFTHSHETLLWAKKSKSSKHTFNYQITKEWDDYDNGSKQMRSMWKIPTTPKSEKESGNFPAQKPIELMKRVILSSTLEGDLIIDPFHGSGTTGLVATTYNRKYIGIEESEEHIELSLKRLKEFKITSLQPNVLSFF